MTDKIIRMPQWEAPFLQGGKVWYEVPITGGWELRPIDSWAVRMRFRYYQNLARRENDRKRLQAWLAKQPETVADNVQKTWRALLTANKAAYLKRAG